MAIPEKNLPVPKADEKAIAQPFNLLSIPLIKKFMQSRWYPGIFQWIVIMVFSYIVFELVAGTVNPSKNFGTTMTWVLWWPIIPILFIALGRFWCAICPFGKLSDIVRKLVGSERPMPKFLKKYGIWMIDLFFIMITFSDHVWGIVESPRGSGYLLLVLVTMVVGTSVFYERRTFCKTLCFLGGLAGNYSRAGSLELRGTPEICKTCKSQSCFKGSDKAEGCPMFQFVRTMDSSAECNVCANCIKNCPNDSIRLSFRKPTKELWFIKNPKLEHAALAAVIMGIVFVQNITMLEIWGEILAAIGNMTGTNSYVINFSIAYVISMALPILLLLGTAKLANRMGMADTVKRNFIRFGYAIIPLDLAGHLGHNLFHVITEGKAIWYNSIALFGFETYPGSLALMPTSAVQLLQYAVIAIGFFGSMLTVYKMGGNSKIKGMLPIYGLMLLLAVINIYLFSLPMSHRV
ncbi:4Fe-4S binding protein [Neobacillus notoginsengisoli]|uniref:4Fe-4S binding protein n=1 Tax=Neobacillus notoginsengisoli TaxID=1578198 RepID=A0A417YSE2_9BACI|nr:4Fe-4S binding protein [Neobacillus notoginsengisoli]RHW38890.1 4Fe-4S binding protein [Neobacillus notoginsengisoli]